MLALMFCAGFLSFGLARQASAATYYVSPSGSNTSPYDTWAKAANVPLTITNLDSVSGNNTVYIAPGTYSSYLYTWRGTWDGTTFQGTAAHGSTVSAASGQIVLNVPAGQHGFQVMAPNITLNDITIENVDSTHYGMYLSQDGFVGNRVRLINGGTNSLLYVYGTHTTNVFNNFFFSGSDAVAPINITGATPVTLNFPIMTASESKSLGSEATNSTVVTNSGSAVTTINNGLILGTPEFAVRNTGTGETHVYNSILAGGYRSSNSYVGVATNGKLIVDHSLLILPLWVSAQDFTSSGSGTVTDTNNTKTNKPLFTSHMRQGIIVPRVDDAGNSAYAATVANILATYGKKGTFYAQTADVTGSNLMGALALDAGGVMEVGVHGTQHVDVTYTNALTFTQTGGSSCTIAFDSSTKIFTGDCTGSTYDFTYDATGKTLGQVIADISGNGKGWTVAKSTKSGAQDSAAIDIRIPVTSLATLSATSAPTDVLFDRTDDVSKGYFKDEILQAKTNMESTLGHSVYSWAYPYNSHEAHSQAAVMNSGFWSGSSAITSAPYGNWKLNSINASMVGAADISLSSSDETIFKTKIRGMAEHVAQVGGIFFILSHNTEGLSEEQWIWMLDVLTQEYPEIAITSAKGAMDIIKAGWSTADNITYTKTFTDQSNYNLQSTSPSIDSGTNVSLTSDYAGNPIYGAPDIGAYEYQPPYTFVSNNIPTTGSIRLYTNGQYRMVNASTTSNKANFSVTPAGGYNSATTTQYMDISIDSWLTTGTKNKQWTATSTAGDFLTHATSTIYTIGDLSPNTYYQFKLDGIASSTAVTGYGSTTCNVNGSCLSDANGQVQFTYTGGYSTHTFALAQDIISPSAFTLVSPIDGSASGGTQSFSWNASSDTESGLYKYQLYINNTLNTDNISSSITSVTSNNVSCGSSWHIRAIDNNGNYTDSNTFSLGMPCGSGGGGSYSATAAAATTESTTSATTTTAVASSTLPTLESIQTRISSVVAKISILPKIPSVSDLASIQFEIASILNELKSIRTTPTFTKPLTLGMVNDDVKNLQQVLKQDSSIYPEGLITGYFGSLTLKAIKRFQDKYNIAHEGDPAYGYVGPRTRERLNRGSF